jgi:hypothetical protein
MAELTGVACRGARGLLRWQQRDLVAASGVSLPTVFKLEDGGQVADETARKIVAAFLAHGVEIVAEPGRTGAIAILAELRPLPKKTERRPRAKA